ncbi:tRNA (5-methylaminomethyl-2-thiouridylate)-methyltransferase [Isosphaera pallida ATCC 43644]|uniref:tRNA-specific 2-thiouridylase MnmA n=1 Tax=Isosphaera pallida (strain ATCC 43644 / DSM 9630 / IS1B) TaxID=575540 RepID=E8R659_ISOPI|nr:tRNA 2-thiouridine(34) synthase MnmA [Isosphaera pallida]ADV60754.1 tRNA (5-methylaminomethyl-2-thiouridylate)-methyltransferase [Isosphaera pallida ATCC 43644]
MNRPRVVLAMSGGVDSSVAAGLLKNQGYDVVGLFMRTGVHFDDPTRRAKTCCSQFDALDAQAVADRLDIPFHALDFEADFGRIMEDFTEEYLRGRTPNPCVMCNIWLKFGKLWAYGKKVGADFVATGHYARVVQDESGRPRIARGVDRAKDQSYVLSGVRREILQRMLLPVGGFTKEEIRAKARDWNLPVHSKADSQEICFIPDHDYVKFIRERRPNLETAGEVVDESGRVVGTHDGYEGFTVGQRKGLKIAFGEPRYVIQIDPRRRQVVVGDRTALVKPGLIADRFNWHLDPPEPGQVWEVVAQIRSQHAGVPALLERLEPSARSEGGERVVVRFAEPQSAITPGQVVTLYDCYERVVGGGWIERPLEADASTAPAKVISTTLQDALDAEQTVASVRNGR